MTNTANLATLSSILDSAILSWEADYLNIKLSAIEDVISVKKCIEALGYTAEIEHETAQDHTSFWISNLNNQWEEERSIFFFKNKDSFWLEQKILRESDYFYITQEKISNFSSVYSDFCVALDCRKKWHELLINLADHQGTQGAPDALIYFVGSDKGARKYEISPSVSLPNLMLLATSAAYETAKKLFAILTIGDAQNSERKETMRVALVDYLDNCETTNYFEKILEGHEKLFSKYIESFETYIHRFSINEILEEVADKNIEYTNKLNDAIASAQLKAFAIPGALIAIGAIIKSVNTLDLALVCFGLWIIRQMTISANEIHLSIFDNLQNQVMNSFARFKKTQIEKEVKIVANEATDTLSILIKKGKTRIKSINMLANLMFGAGTLYLTIKFIQETFNLSLHTQCIFNCQTLLQIANH
ncbi:MAG: hypothetical protein ACLGJE_23190 [Gammaproteobacteria bacterium]